MRRAFKEPRGHEISRVVALIFLDRFRSEKLELLYWYLQRTQSHSMRPTAMITICEYYINHD